MDSPIYVYRGNYIESSHNVHIAVVHVSGEVIAYYGDPYRQTFARSSMKPFQAIPIAESGTMEAFSITEKELALFCASHSGEQFHRQAVAEVLKKINLEEEYLQCGTHIPIDMESYCEVIKDGKKLSALYSNCSGKHVGMLAACKKQAIDVHTYRELSHPYQQQILTTISDITSYKRERISIAVDGCGVPVHRIPLYNLALAFSRLAAPDNWKLEKKGESDRKQALKRIRDAMTTFPDMVAGTKRFDTDLMSAYQGRIVAKGGAEGVHCFADKETGIGVAIKVADGNARAASVASMEVLRQLNIDPLLSEQLADYRIVPVHNARKESIGKIVAAFQLNFLC